MERKTTVYPLITLNFMFALLLKMFLNDWGYIFRDFKMPDFLISTCNGSQKTIKKQEN